MVKLAMVQQQRLAHQVFSLSGVDLYGGCIYQGIQLRVAASWFGWRAKSITSTRMPARYTLFLTTKGCLYNPSTSELSGKRGDCRGCCNVSYQERLVRAGQ